MSRAATRVRVAIVGAGFAGLGTALRLHARGEESFVVLERADSVGGTWRDNRYPGAACDVPAHLYCFSFLPNPGFTRTFAPGEEIRAYLEAAADPVRDRLRLGTTVEGADWAGDRWVLTTSRGIVEADALVLACGRLTEPMLPDVAGGFAGPVFHSSRWDDDVDLRGKRVAIVGTGASAVQLAPHVVREAASVVVMQRTASYVLPRDDHAYTPEQRRRFAEHPEELAELRAATYLEAEALYDARVGDDAARGRARDRALGHLAAQVADPALHAFLRPDHEFGCKRVLFSNEYYPALTQPHVTVTGPLTAYEHDAVVDAAGRRHEVDVVVLATGFHTTRQPFASIVRGRGGRTLDEHWARGMQAYASTTVHGFPNLFVLDGPHASLSHNSAVLMIEAQVEYVLGALPHVAAGRVLEVSAAAEQGYADEIDRRSADRPWLSGCANAYVDPRSGRQTLLWPGRVDEFRERLAVFDLAPYTAPARWTVVIPVRPAGKTRLDVPGVDHAELARAIALDTIEAASAVADVRVVTTDPTLALPGTTLVREREARGIAEAVRLGLAGVGGPCAVLLGDLPGLEPADLAYALRRAASHTRSAVADAEGTGTTLVTASAGHDLVPSFGPDSWRRHLADGFAPLDVPAGSTIRRDVDLAEHLTGPLGPRTAAVLASCHTPV